MEVNDNERKNKFEEIYQHNFWAEKETKSGGGSLLKNTEKLRAELPFFLKKYNIRSIMDCGCGDLNWIKAVADLPIYKFIGIDIVEDLIVICENAVLRHSKIVYDFYVKDIVEDDLDEVVDLILCKDVFIHLPTADVIKALLNFKKSGSRYLLTSQGFDIKENADITVGECRGLNLMIPPYNLGNPIDSILVKEGHSYLSLWDLSKIKVGECPNCVINDHEWVPGTGKKKCKTCGEVYETAT